MLIVYISLIVISLTAVVLFALVAKKIIPIQKKIDNKIQSPEGEIEDIVAAISLALHQKYPSVQGDACKNADLTLESLEDIVAAISFVVHQKFSPILGEDEVVAAISLASHHNLNASLKVG